MKNVMNFNTASFNYCTPKLQFRICVACNCVAFFPPHSAYKNALMQLHYQISRIISNLQAKQILRIRTRWEWVEEEKNCWISSRSPCTLTWQRQHSEASVAFKYFVFSHRTLNLRRLIHIYCIYSRSYISKDQKSIKP